MPQALSYYKIFGYPTGLGALLIRRDAVPVLRKRFFGGGTVDVSVSNADFFRCSNDYWRVLRAESTS